MPGFYLNETYLSAVKSAQARYLSENALRPYCTGLHEEKTASSLRKSKVNLIKGKVAPQLSVAMQQQQQQQQQTTFTAKRPPPRVMALDLIEQSKASIETVDLRQLGVIVNRSNINDLLYGYWTQELKRDSCNLTLLWEQFVGLKVNEGVRGAQIADMVQLEAMKQVLKHWPDFQSGVVAHNLPVEFYWRKVEVDQQVKWALCFDLSMFRENVTPLTMQLEIPKLAVEETALSLMIHAHSEPDFLKQNPEGKMSEETALVVEAVEVLLTATASLEQKQQAWLMLLAHYPAGVDQGLISGIQSRCASFSWNSHHFEGLTRVLLTHGLPGVALFLDRLKGLASLGRLLHFDEIFLSDPKRYPDLIKAENLSDWTLLSKMSVDQYAWWVKLTGNQRDLRVGADFHSLSNGFSYFLKQLEELIPQVKARTLPRIECSDQPMQVWLDRALFILQHSPYPDEQLKCLKGLDFGPTGAYLAVESQGYRFCSKKMNLSPHREEGASNETQVKIDYRLSGIQEVFNSPFDAFVERYFRYLGMQTWRAGEVKEYTRFIEYADQVFHQFSHKRAFLSILLATTTTQHAVDSTPDMLEAAQVLVDSSNKCMAHFGVEESEFWPMMAECLQALDAEKQVTLLELAHFLIELKENLPSSEQVQLKTVKKHFSLLSQYGRGMLSVFECAKMRKKRSDGVTPLDWTCLLYFFNGLEESYNEKKRAQFLAHANQWLVLLGVCKEGDGQGFPWSTHKYFSYSYAFSTLMEAFEKTPKIFAQPLLDKLTQVNLSLIKVFPSTDAITSLFKDVQSWPQDLSDALDIDRRLNELIDSKLPGLGLGPRAHVNELNYSLLTHFQYDSTLVTQNIKAMQRDCKAAMQEDAWVSAVQLEPMTKEEAVVFITGQNKNRPVKKTPFFERLGEAYFVDPFTKRFEGFKEALLSIFKSLQTQPFQAEPLLPFLKKLEKLGKEYWGDINGVAFRTLVNLLFSTHKKEIDEQLKEFFFGPPPHPPHITFIPFLDEQCLSFLWGIGNVQWVTKIFPSLKAIFDGLAWFSNEEMDLFSNKEKLFEHLHQIQTNFRQLMKLKSGGVSIHQLLKKLSVLKESKMKARYALLLCLARDDLDIVEICRPFIEAYFSYCLAAANAETNLDVLFQKMDKVNEEVIALCTQTHEGVTGLDMVEEITRLQFEGEHYPQALQAFLHNPTCSHLIKDRIEYAFTSMIEKYVTQLKLSGELGEHVWQCFLANLGEIDSTLSLSAAFKQFQQRFESVKACLNGLIQLKNADEQAFLNVTRIFMLHYDQGCAFDQLHALLVELMALPHSLIPQYFSVIVPCLYDAAIQPLKLDEQAIQRACMNLRHSIKSQPQTSAGLLSSRNAFAQGLLGEETTQGSTQEHNESEEEDWTVEPLCLPERDLNQLCQLTQLESVLNETKNALDGHGFSADFKQTLAGDVVQVNAFAFKFAQLSMDELQQLHLDALNALRKQPDGEVTLLDCRWLAIARELMYRTTGIFPNATQLMVCLLAWRTKGRVLFEINTGEGKGFLSALLAAREWVRVGTVDVLSANLGLIQQDYEQKRNREFFKSLKIPSRILRANDKQPYKTGYVSYTTFWDRSFKASEVTLSPNGGEAYPHAAAIFDECDWGLLRMVGITFDFVSTLPGDENQAHEWIYDKILDFTKSRAFLRIDPKRGAVLTSAEDLTQLKLSLYQSADEAQKEQCDTFEELRLDQWLNAACDAQMLVEGVHFIVQSDPDHQGCEMAVPMIKDVPQLGARFTGAVQPFLHALLTKKYPNKRFSIPSELACVDTQSPAGLSLCYPRLIGMSGTLGVKKELMRLMTRLGASSWTIPPHMISSSSLEALPVQLLLDSTRHIQRIYDQISMLKQDKTDAPPVLIIEEDINACRTLFEKLLSYQRHGWTVQVVTGEEDPVQKAAILTQAALSNTLTVCTPLFARGLDLKPHHPDGLWVMIACLREDNVIRQAKGRTGRYGKSGHVAWFIDASRYGLQDAVALPQHEQEARIKAFQNQCSDDASIERYYTEEAALIREAMLKHFDGICRALMTHCPEKEAQACFNRLLRLRQTLLTKAVRVWNQGLYQTDPNHQFTNPYVRRAQGLQSGIGMTSELEKCLQDYPDLLKAVWTPILDSLNDEVKRLNLSSDAHWKWRWESEQDLVNEINFQKIQTTVLPVGSPGERAEQPWKWQPHGLESFNPIRFAEDEAQKQEAIMSHIRSRFKHLFKDPLFKSLKLFTLKDDYTFEEAGVALKGYVQLLLKFPQLRPKLALDSFKHCRELAFECLGLYQTMAHDLPKEHHGLAKAVFELQQTYVTDVGQTLTLHLAKQFQWAKKGARGAKYWLNRPLVRSVMKEIEEALQQAQQDGSDEAFLALQTALEKQEQALKGRWMLPWTRTLPAQIAQAKLLVSAHVPQNLSQKRAIPYQVGRSSEHPSERIYFYEAHTGFESRAMKKIEQVKHETPPPNALCYQPRFGFIADWKNDLAEQKAQLKQWCMQLQQLISAPERVLENVEPLLFSKDLLALREKIIQLKALFSMEELPVGLLIYNETLTKNVAQFQMIKTLTWESLANWRGLPAALGALQTQKIKMEEEKETLEKELESDEKAMSLERAAREKDTLRALQGIFSTTLMAFRQGILRKSARIKVIDVELNKMRDQCSIMHGEDMKTRHQQLKRQVEELYQENLNDFQKRAQPLLSSYQARLVELEQQAEEIDERAANEVERSKTAVFQI